MMSRSSSACVLAIPLILVPANAIAQNVQAQTVQADLVVQWPDPVLQWNALALATAGGKDPITQQRILDIVHLAIFEAVNAIVGDYEPYLGSVSTIPGASPEA